MANKDREASRRRKGGEWLPFDVFGQDRPESRLAGFMRMNHASLLLATIGGFNDRSSARIAPIILA
ncbi:MAG: hypothetical protein JO188_17360 [Hyphomicrobiales bacterium]|nr:hypothetical protein [Hyphomicrobiales bacterium]